MNATQRKAVEACEEFGEHEQTLAEFFDSFIKRHAVQGQEAGVIVLDVSAEECETLGRSFIKVMVGWAAGLIPSRVRRGIAPVTIQSDELNEFDEDRKGPIN